MATAVLANSSCLPSQFFLGKPQRRPRFTALPYFVLDGTGYAASKSPPKGHKGVMLRRYLIWRNNHACNGGSARSSIGPMLPGMVMARQN